MDAINNVTEENLKERFKARAKGYKRVDIGIFPTMQDLMAAALTSKSSLLDYWGVGHRAGWYGLEPEFKGGKMTMQGVCDLLGKGWERGLLRMQESMDKLRNVEVRPLSIKRRNTWQDQGDTLDIHRVYSGQLDRAWQKCKRRPLAGTRNITLVCDTIESGGNDAETMFWRGAAVVTLADKLTAAGYNVEVVSAWTGRMSSLVICHVTVKQSWQPLDIPTLTAAVACPAYFRCIGHCWGNKVDGDDNHGYSVDQWIPGPGEIMATHDRRWTQEVARQWVEEKIAEIDAAALIPTAA